MLGIEDLRVLRRKLKRSLQIRGALGTVRHAGSNLLGRFYESTRAKGNFEQRESIADESFDREFGVDTSGMISVDRLDVKADNWVHGSAYVPTPKDVFEKILSSLNVDLNQFVFIDLGCGKGRVLLMASAACFKRIVGIDFSAELAQIARQNVERYRGRRLCSDVQVETTDVVNYPLPNDPLILFLYHPFDEVVMQVVVERVRESYANNPRPMLVVYFKPVHDYLWDQAGFLRRTASTTAYKIYST